MIYLLYDYSSQYHIDFMTLCFKFLSEFYEIQNLWRWFILVNCEFFKILLDHTFVTSTSKLEFLTKVFLVLFDELD